MSVRPVLPGKVGSENSERGRVEEKIKDKNKRKILQPLTFLLFQNIEKNRRFNVFIYAY